MAQDIEIQIKTAIDSADTAKNIGQLKKSLVELQTIAEKSDLGAEQQQKIQQSITQTTAKMANLTEKVGDIRDSVRTLDGSPVERLKNSFGLLGEGIGNLDFGKVITGLRGVAAAIAANPIGAIATAVLTLVTAFGGLDAIMSVVTSTIDGVKSALFGMTKEKKEANKVTEDAISNYAKEKVGLDDLFTSLSDVTLSSDERKVIIDEINTKYGDYLPNMLTEKSNAEEIAKAYDDVNDALVRKALTEAKAGAVAQATQQLLLESVEIQGRLNKARSAELAVSSMEQIERTRKAREAIELELQKSKDKYETEISKINSSIQNLEAMLLKNVEDGLKKTIKKKEDAAKKNSNIVKTQVKDEDEIKRKALEEELRLLIEAEQAKVVVLEQGSTARFEAEMNSINVIEEFYKKYYKGLGITEAGFTIIKAENVEKRKKLEKEYYDYKNNLKTIDIEEVKLKNDDDVRLNKMASDAIVQIDNTTYQSKADKRKEEIRGLAEVATEAQKYAQMGAQIVTGIADLVFDHKKKNLEKGSAEEQKVAKKQFEFGRAVQLSLAIVDGFKAITTSLANSPIAFGPIPNPAGIASLAFAAATTAINIAKIAAMKFQPNPTPPSNNPPSPPSGGGGGLEPQTPTFQPTQFFGLGQTVAGLGGEQGGPTRVYVTEGDISNTQNRVRVVENRARFG